MNDKRAEELINTYVEQVKDSNEIAFEKLFQQLWEPLYSYASAILEDRDLAKDMVQEVWIDFWERRHKIKNDNVQAYLYKAVRFRVFKEIRDSKLKASHLEALKIIYETTHDQEAPNKEETHKILAHKLSTLPDKCKEVFTLSHIDGLKNKEIAEELDIAESTVENHITKAVKLLKKGVAFMFVLLLCCDLPIHG